MNAGIQYDPKNEAEVAYWNSTAGRHWVERQESQDTLLAPILTAALERAQARPGERVVDIGCGTGASSIELGKQVASGQVLGVDVSAPMLARAGERIPPGAPIKFVRADATTYKFEPAAFDLLFSRFGVMFFAEPARAFANLRAALKPGGRLVFACWRKFDEMAGCRCRCAPRKRMCPLCRGLAPRIRGRFHLPTKRGFSAFWLTRGLPP